MTSMAVDGRIILGSRTVGGSSSKGPSEGPSEGSNEWFDSLTQISGPKGSNSGGVFKDANGDIWYVKEYSQLGQAYSEQVSNAIYRKVGASVPQSVVSPAGKFASKWIAGQSKTLAAAGLSRGSANAVLDHFVADVLTANWDAVGLVHDNALIREGGEIVRVDQGGTFLYRAQGGLKPESGLDGISEWDSLSSVNPAYSKVFQRAGVFDGNALGKRAIDQIDAVVAARPATGWAALVEQEIPRAASAFKARVSQMLESRQKRLESKRIELASRFAGGVGSGITGHVTAHDKAVAAHERAVETHSRIRGDEDEVEDEDDDLPSDHHDPTIVRSVQEAIPLILEGKTVELKNVGKVNTLLTKLAAIAKDAEKKGKNAPNYDACKITVGGSSVFCGDSLRTKEYPNGLPRIIMPQMNGKPRKGSKADLLPKDEDGNVDIGPEFLHHLEGLGIETSSESVKASHLMASQNELVGSIIAKRVAKKEYTASSPIFISRDNYIIDGHHRWAAVVGRDAEDKKLGDLKIRVVRVDIPISEALHIATKWSKKYGLDGQAAAQKKARASLAETARSTDAIRSASLQPDASSLVQRGWQRAKDGLTKLFTFPNRRSLASFLSSLFADANAVNHHPDVSVEGDGVFVTYTTHQANNTVTGLDHVCTQRADAIALLTPPLLEVGPVVYPLVQPPSRLSTAGGAGSGNFHHGGRPGSIGGSSEGGSSESGAPPAYAFQVTGPLDFSQIVDRRFLFNSATNRLILGAESPDQYVEGSHGEVLENLKIPPRAYDGFTIRGKIGDNWLRITETPTGRSTDPESSDALHALYERIISAGGPKDLSVSAFDGPSPISDRLLHLGGVGSGNFHHSGRPGSIGGSSSDGPDASGAWFVSQNIHDSIEALPRHSNPIIASQPGFEGRATPLHLAGVSTRSPAWTDDKPEVEAAFGSFSEAMTRGVEVEMDIDDLSTYQTFVSGTRLEALSKIGVNFDKPTGVVFPYGGKNWLVDGNHRTSLASLEGRRTVKLIRIRSAEERSQSRAAARFATVAEYELSTLPPEIEAWLESFDQPGAWKWLLNAIRSAGGSGSGNFGHGGRPGTVGGSGTTDPMSGEPHGLHTPAAQARVIAYLTNETGGKFKPHGSVGKGGTSVNDMDIVLQNETDDMSDVEREAWEAEQTAAAGRATDELTDRVTRGEITEQQMMEQLYGDGPAEGSVEHALAKIGFRPVNGAEWLGIETVRYENPKTGHTIEIWQKGQDPNFYGLSSARSAAKGNWGHKGRPGSVGGSSASSGFERATKADAARMGSLQIPPAWKNVMLNPDLEGDLQATGEDVKGRTQYRYHANHAAAAAAEKFDRLKAFNDALPALRVRIGKDVTSSDDAIKEPACVMCLIERTGFRIGSDTDTHADKKAYGASNLDAKHVKVHGDDIAFSFIGKKGVLIEKELTDATLANMLRPRVKKGGRLFDADGGTVRGYLASRAEGFTPKDFRTWHGTNQALQAIEGIKIPKNATEWKASTKKVATVVSDFLGNTPNVALKSYIDPAVFARWKAAQPPDKPKKAKA